MPLTGGADHMNVLYEKTFSQWNSIIRLNLMTLGGVLL